MQLSLRRDQEGGEKQTTDVNPQRGKGRLVSPELASTGGRGLAEAQLLPLLQSALPHPTKEPLACDQGHVLEGQSSEHTCLSKPWTPPLLRTGSHS